MKAGHLLHQTGFSLLHLIVAMAIIGLLIATMNGLKERSVERRAAAADQAGVPDMSEVVANQMGEQMYEAAVKAKYGNAAPIDPKIAQQLQQAQQMQLY